MTHPARATAVALSKTAALTLALSACAAGPDFVRPDAPAPDRFAASALYAAEAAPAATDGAAFWRGFGDPRLDALVDDALRANHDLRIALARLDRADALLRGARFDRLPTITAEAAATDGRQSVDQAVGAPRDYENYEGGVRLAWELDLFGRVRRGVEAQRAEADATRADLAAMQVAVVAEVVGTYAELRGQQERLRVAEANAGLQRETLRLVEARLAAGSGTEFDTARARAQLEATLARVPALQTAVAVATHRLAVLTGRSPDALATALSAPQALPSLPATLAADTPADVLRRRPDIAAAEQRLHAATARIGVATAEFFPRLTLSGLLGVQSFDADTLGDSGSGTRLVALGIDWSFLDVGRVRARIAAADADARGALASYEQTVLRALEDAENALVRHARTRQEDAHLAAAAGDSAEAARLARLRYDAGAAGLLEVLDAERTRLQAEDALAEARTRSVVSAVAVYRATAGGWPDRSPDRVPVAGR
jgi:multidrug efflux system outer membrane protein